MAEESSLVVGADLGKLAEELAAHFNGQWRSLVLTVQLQLELASTAQELFPGSARADAEVGLHQLEDGGVDVQFEEKARVAVEQVAMVDGPARETQQ